VSTVTSSRHAHETHRLRHFGSPEFWRAVALLGRGGDRNSRSCSADMADVEAEIAGLFDRSTQQLRLAWRKAHRTGPPVSLSRDLPIRGLANQLQERIHGGPAARCVAACTPCPERWRKALCPPIPVPC